MPKQGHRLAETTGRRCAGLAASTRSAEGGIDLVGPDVEQGRIEGLEKEVSHIDDVTLWMPVDVVVMVQTGAAVYEVTR